MSVRIRNKLYIITHEVFMRCCSESRTGAYKDVVPKVGELMECRRHGWSEVVYVRKLAS